MVDSLYNAGLQLLTTPWWSSVVWPVLWTLLKIVVVLLPLMGCVAYLTSVSYTHLTLPTTSRV